MLTRPKTAFSARLATNAADIHAAQKLRHLAFYQTAASDISAVDTDAFDDICTHVLIEDAATKQLVCCFRLLTLQNSRQIDRSYAAQYYDLHNLAAFDGVICEIGRFCLHPDWHDPDILRLAWAVLTRHVDEFGVKMLFGCSSFKGVDPAAYTETFALLKDKYLAPAALAPQMKSAEVYDFYDDLAGHVCDVKQGFAQMPSLLRTYVMMGGWVSDHAVIDRQLNTLHVFTGLEIAAIPAARVRQLRRDAAKSH